MFNKIVDKDVSVIIENVETVPDERQIQPWRNLRLERRGRFKKEDAHYVHIMFNSGICNFELRPLKNHG